MFDVLPKKEITIFELKKDEASLEDAFMKLITSDEEAKAEEVKEENENDAKKENKKEKSNENKKKSKSKQESVKDTENKEKGGEK